MRYRRPDSEEGVPTLGERLLMALLAPLMFNVSLLFLSGGLFRRSRLVERTLLSPASHSSSFLFLAALLLVGLPALAGFVLGVNRTAILLGHLFYTNFEHERSPAKTLLAWAGLILIAWLLPKLLGL